MHTVLLYSFHRPICRLRNRAGRDGSIHGLGRDGLGREISAFCGFGWVGFG